MAGNPLALRIDLTAKWELAANDMQPGMSVRGRLAGRSVGRWPIEIIIETRRSFAKFPGRNFIPRNSFRQLARRDAIKFKNPSPIKAEVNNNPANLSSTTDIEENDVIYSLPEDVPFRLSIRRRFADKSASISGTFSWKVVTRPSSPSPDRPSLPPRSCSSKWSRDQTRDRRRAFHGR